MSAWVLTQYTDEITSKCKKNMLTRKRKYPFGTLSEDLSMKWKNDVSENSLALQGLLSGRNCTDNYFFKNMYTNAVNIDCSQKIDVIRRPSDERLEGMEVQDSCVERQIDVCNFKVKDSALSNTSIRSDLKISTPCSRCQAGEPGHIQHILH